MVLLTLRTSDCGGQAIFWRRIVVLVEGREQWVALDEEDGVRRELLRKDCDRSTTGTMSFLVC